MTDLAELYQGLILDHNRSPRNYGAPAESDANAEGRNPLCGDELTVWVRLDGDRLEDVRFEGKGCAISRASASLMTAAVKGKSRDEALDLFERFHGMVTGKSSADDPALGRLAALGGVARFPTRVKCASLAWHTLKAALEQREPVVSTE